MAHIEERSREKRAAGTENAETDTIDGRRKRGRPKTTWRRTVEKERNKMGFTSWNTAAAAKDRDSWRDLVNGPIFHDGR